MKKMFNEIRDEKEGIFCKREYIGRIYPVSEAGVRAFRLMQLENDEAYWNYVSFSHDEENRADIKRFILSRYLDKPGMYYIKSLDYETDYAIEIVEVINHQYEPGLTWSDIKAL